MKKPKREWINTNHQMPFHHTEVEIANQEKKLIGKAMLAGGKWVQPNFDLYRGPTVFYWREILDKREQ